LYIRIRLYVQLNSRIFNQGPANVKLSGKARRILVFVLKVVLFTCVIIINICTGTTEVISALNRPVLTGFLFVSVDQLLVQQEEEQHPEEEFQ